MVNRHFILFALAFAAALSGVAKTFDIDISTGRPAAANEAYYHGETIEFRAVRGRVAVTNIEYGCVYYQTNGMDSVWWHTDGLVFHPTNDVGAASYRFFLEGRDDLGRDWHANGLLRLLPSPGFTPNEIELPVARLDFAAVDVLNPPWTDPDYSTNNTALVATIEATAPAPGNYAAVSNAAMTALQSYTETDPTVSAWAKKSASSAYQDDLGRWMKDDFFSKDENIVTPYNISATGTTSRITVGLSFPNAVLRRGELSVGSDEDHIATYSGNGISIWPWWDDEAFDDVYFFFPTHSPGGTFALDADISAAATAATNYTDSAISTVSAEITPAVAAYPRVYAFMTGSTNASFSVTNYQLTAEADAERTHFDPSDPDLDFSTVPSSLRLEDFSTGTNRVVVDTRDWTVWYYACKIGSAIHTAYTNAVETCRAWVNFTATGLENPVPDTLIVDVPNIWLMAGKTFEKHLAGSNACWVIRSKDTVMPISDNAQSAGGFLELTDAFGEPYIRFNKTESYFVDPQAEGITNTNGTWYIVYPTQTKPNGGANAVIEGSTTYPGKAVLKAEDDPDCPATITWTGGAGHWVMVAVPKLVGGVYPTRMFFGSIVEVEGQDFIEYLRPMSIPHLLVDGVKIVPDIPASHPAGTTISWKVVE